RQIEVEGRGADGHVPDGLVGAHRRGVGEEQREDRGDEQQTAAKGVTASVGECASPELVGGESVRRGGGGIGHGHTAFTGTKVTVGGRQIRGGGHPAISPCALVPQVLVHPLVPGCRTV